MTHVSAFSDGTKSMGLLPARRLAAATAISLIVACGIALGGCNKVSMSDVTGSIGPSTDMPTNNEAALRKFSDEWGDRYETNRRDKKTALTYARALRALGQHAQACAVLQGAAILNPTDMQVLGEYGKALADAGRLREAADILSKAHTPERPNWSILSAQGSVADQLGDHAQAQGYYDAALKIRPDDPTVLSNLGLSYALARDLPRAEATLRRATAQPRADMRVRQNLALVLALEGKFAQAEEISRTDLSAIDAAANVQKIRQVISESNTWREIRQVDRKARS
jgi:Flp pilus assembly protein TadD